MLDGHLYIMVETDHALEVHHCPKDRLLYGTQSVTDGSICASPPLVWDRSEVPLHSENILSIALLAGMSSYGTAAVSICEEADNDQTRIRVRFWPGLRTYNAGGPLVKGGPNVSVTMAGEIVLSSSGHPMVYFGHSGVHILLLVEVPGPQADPLRVVLRLVRFHPETSSATVHTLRIATSMFDISDIQAIALDDHFGNLHATTYSGFVCTVPFADDNSGYPCPGSQSESDFSE